MPIHQKKRKFELGRSPANTKLGQKRIRPVRCRGGNVKFRALRLDHGSYSWSSENISRKTRVLDVVYNASNNELVRTKSLVKNAIVVIDASPFKTWYKTHYGVDIGKKKKPLPGQPQETAVDKKSGHVLALQKFRRQDHQLDPALEEMFASGRLLACISTRPGQTGRSDGYVLEGQELQFYKRKLEKKKSK